ncbi:UDP-2,3-diacylglucosamine diphosphatase [Bernardetia sp. ABR2-2B]|uniref:UDP-2,3-diacylglucosamine diphosphatase n=1 Tax=Bernardetia sp. ABR2-2B TaxID=3127472 RepID=UPI0030CCE395
MKRKVEIVILSDIHLGTYGARVKDLLNYLESIEPQTLILNGDIIDVLQFSKSYFPNSHLQVIQKVLAWVQKGIKTYYIVGNHDDIFRKFIGFQAAGITITDDLELEIGNQKIFIFHGDAFDGKLARIRLLNKMGANGYGSVILMNKAINFLIRKLVRKEVFISKYLKNKSKRFLKNNTKFEEEIISLAIKNGYDSIICGHLHYPIIKRIEKEGKQINYLNSGDWVESLTSIEYHNKEWKLYQHNY